MTKSKLFRLLLSLALSWLAVLGIVGCMQRSFIYFPTRASEAALLARAGSLGLEPWRDTSGAIIGWQRPARPGTRAANRLVVFHGNAGYALNRTYYIAGFEGLDGGRSWEVKLFEYPGYGAREGALGEKPFNAAALAALETLRAADPRPIYLLGESIGSGPACALAGAEPQSVSGLCLVTPLARLGDVAALHNRFLPVRLLLRDRWDNVAALRNYRAPLAMWLAGADEIVTAAQGRLLYDEFTGPKSLWVDPGANHNGLDYHAANPWWRQISDFLLRGPHPAAPPN